MSLEKFRNKNGDHSVYAFVCGYIQGRELSPGVRISLWHEGACYHVRAHDYNAGVRLFWHSTESLTAARRVYRAGKLAHSNQGETS